MGVNCWAYLPPDVDVNGAGEVLGVLSGLPVALKEIGGASLAARVEGVGIRGNVHSDLIDLYVKHPKQGNLLVDGDSCHSVMYHYASRFGGKPYNSMGPPSSPFWLAVMRRLVHWFGGVLVYNDCTDEKGANVYRSKRHCPVDKHGLLPEDGKEWAAYQKALAALPQVTPQEMAAMWRKAAYRDGFDQKTGIRKEA